MPSANLPLREEARSEIDKSIMLSTFSMARLGLTYNDPQTNLAFIRQKIMLILSFFGLFYHIFSDLIFIIVTMSNSPRVEDVVPLFHTFGYGLLSKLSTAKTPSSFIIRHDKGQEQTWFIKEKQTGRQIMGSGKLFAVWYKKDVFGQLLKELVDIWPMPPLDEEAQVVKEKSLAALRTAHQWFFALNMSGVWFYNLTPMVVYCYELWWLGDADAKIGFVWKCWYPFDKYDPQNHVFVYFFEMFSGLTCVWAMIASDLLFTGMASHISLLMRLLQKRLENLTYAQNQQQNYKNIVECIKLHQRLISYCNELERAFSISNLVNIVLSSINICCVVFVIVLLEPFVAISNKLFLGSAMIQVGVICWYSDDIFHSSADVAMAAYNSEWYKFDSRCRRALMFLIKRSQKPIAFTAMKFTNINLNTYSAILTRSYSYFALLYTMYSDT